MIDIWNEHLEVIYEERERYMENAPAYSCMYYATPNEMRFIREFGWETMERCLAKLRKQRKEMGNDRG